MFKDYRYFIVFIAFFAITLQYGCGSGGNKGEQTPQKKSKWVISSVGSWGGVKQVVDASVISDSTSEEICALSNTRKAMRSFELSGRFSLPNGINLQGISFITNENQAIPEVCFMDENGVQSSFCARTYAELPIIEGSEHEIIATNGRTYYTSFDTGVNGYIFINRFSGDIVNKASLYYYLATESVHIASMKWGQESLRDEVFGRAINMGCGRRKAKPEVPQEKPNGGGGGNPNPKGEPVNPSSESSSNPGGGDPQNPNSGSSSNTGGAPVNPNS